MFETYTIVNLDHTGQRDFTLGLVPTRKLTLRAMVSSLGIGAATGAGGEGMGRGPDIGFGEGMVEGEVAELIELWPRSNAGPKRVLAHGNMRRYLGGTGCLDRVALGIGLRNVLTP